MSLRLLTIASLLCLGASPAFAADEAAVKAKAMDVCAACHGENGVSVMDNTPSLAGQPDLFLQWQLVFFRAGARKSEAMQAVAEGLDNADIRSLAAYYAALPPPTAPKDDDPQLSEKGKQAAMGRRCASCHTDSYAGAKATARLAGQREDYLKQSLLDYKASKRTGNGVAAMAEIARVLSDEEIEALAHYLAHL
jgi:cytochrome c553